MATLLGCGILEYELKTIVKTLDTPVDIQILPAVLHLHPLQLKKELEHALQMTGAEYVVYGKCCPGIDDLCKTYKAHRIKGETCYDILAGDTVSQLLQKEPGTYFLLPRFCEEFEELTKELDLKKTRDVLFKNYKRLVLLDTGVIPVDTRHIVKTLDLPCETVHVGVKPLEERLTLLLKREPGV